MAAANPFGTSVNGNPPEAQACPAFNAAAVTLSDTDDLAVVARALYVGTTGNITLITPNGQTVLFTAVPVGILPVMCSRVKSTGTTASTIVALW